MAFNRKKTKNLWKQYVSKVQELADENSWKSQTKANSRKNIDNWANCAQIVHYEFFSFLISKLFEHTRMPRKNFAFLVGQTNNMLTCHTHQITASILPASDSSEPRAVSSSPKHSCCWRFLKGQEYPHIISGPNLLYISNIAFISLENLSMDRALWEVRYTI